MVWNSLFILIRMEIPQWNIETEANNNTWLTKCPGSYSISLRIANGKTNTQKCQWHMQIPYAPLKTNHSNNGWEASDMINWLGNHLWLFILCMHDINHIFCNKNEIKFPSKSCVHQISNKIWRKYTLLLDLRKWMLLDSLFSWRLRFFGRVYT